jgi:hypothetical protein
VIGALEFNTCSECSCLPCCAKTWAGNNCCKGCCPGMSTPTGPEWEAAQPGFQTFLDEAATVGSAAGKGCCNCAPPPDSLRHMLKALLGLVFGTPNGRL